MILDVTYIANHVRSFFFCWGSFFMGIYNHSFLGLLVGVLKNEVYPKCMHEDKHSCHSQQKFILETYSVPYVCWFGSICPNLRQNTERIDDSPKVDP